MSIRLRAPKFTRRVGWETLEVATTHKEGEIEARKRGAHVGIGHFLWAIPANCHVLKYTLSDLLPYAKLGLFLEFRLAVRLTGWPHCRSLTRTPTCKWPSCKAT